jgi:hypothetical protein
LRPASTSQSQAFSGFFLTLSRGISLALLPAHPIYTQLIVAEHATGDV